MILSCFKAYDIRGKAPDQLNAAFASALGQALYACFSPQKAVTGRDARSSSPELENALGGALGCHVESIGLCGTEEIYNAAASGDYDLGIMVTGSHNPANENGFKIVRKGAVPVGDDSGLREVAKHFGLLYSPDAEPPLQTPHFRDLRPRYVDWLLGYTKFDRATAPARQFRLVADAGNGCAGPMLECLAPFLPVEIIGLNFTPDGSFPNGVPNPLLPEMRRTTANAVLANNADLGVAFDGDFDRCFFFDESGQMVESCYLVGLLARQLLASHPGSKIVHDPRVYWHTREQVAAAGGIPVLSRGGHTYMKEKMRAENALYGGEMSAHHFFRDFAYCDSGMLAMLLLLKMLLDSPQTLGEITAAAIKAYPCSGELNFRVENPGAILESVWRRYIDGASHADRIDGINMEFPQWRFNLRASNTEPLMRLNIETRANRNLLEDKIGELAKAIGS